MATVVILANGERPEGESLEILRAAEHVIACDGAYAFAKELGVEPDLVVGDCDSLSPDDRAALGPRLVCVDEQETNDLEKAFSTALAFYAREERRDTPEGEKRFHVLDGMVIVGAGGGRADHLIGNVFRLLSFAQWAPDLAMVSNDGRFDVVDGIRTFASRPGQAVSVFVPTPGAALSSTGLEWPLDGVDLRNLWTGTLNRAVGDSFTVESSVPALVYRAVNSRPPALRTGM